jgi:hypothetical protein
MGLADIWHAFIQSLSSKWPDHWPPHYVNLLAIWISGYLSRELEIGGGVEHDDV